MKKISKRAWMALALAAALLAGLLVFFGEYFIEAKTWVAFPGSPHVYTGVNPDCGKIYDRSGMLLLNTNDGRVYNADEAVRGDASPAGRPRRLYQRAAASDLCL